MPYILEKNHVNRLEHPSVIIYPNPSDNQIHISSNSDAYRITLTDANGRVLTNEKPGKKNHTLVTKTYSTGIYLITIETREGVFSQKIVIQH
jgi:hypothetical protein